jgi:hypothetical protein
MGFERWTSLNIKGTVTCGSAIPKIELQVCLATFGINGTVAIVECIEENGHPYVTMRNSRGGRTGGFVGCQANATYAVWAWVGIFGLFGTSGRVAEGSKYGDSHSNVCTGGFPPGPAG